MTTTVQRATTLDDIIEAGRQRWRTWEAAHPELALHLAPPPGAPRHVAFYDARGEANYEIADALARQDGETVQRLAVDHRGTLQRAALSYLTSRCQYDATRS